MRCRWTPCVYQDGAFREQRVALADGAFRWHTGEVVGAGAERYLRRYYPAARGGPLVRSEPGSAGVDAIASPRR